MKRGNSFYSSDEYLIYVVGLQKSSFTNGYYLNLGFFIKELHLDVAFPKYMEADIQTRFSFILPSVKKTDLVDFDADYLISKKQIEQDLQTNFDNLIQSTKEKGLRKLLRERPVLLYQTTLIAKKHLDID